MGICILSGLKWKRGGGWCPSANCGLDIRLRAQLSVLLLKKIFPKSEVSNVTNGNSSLCKHELYSNFVKFYAIGCCPSTKVTKKNSIEIMGSAVYFLVELIPFAVLEMWCSCPTFCRIDAMIELYHQILFFLFITLFPGSYKIFRRTSELNNTEFFVYHIFFRCFSLSQEKASGIYCAVILLLIF